MNKDTLELLSTYNLWANDQITGYLATQERGDLKAYRVSSFPSIQKTLKHIRNAEWMWHERLKGHSPESLEYESEKTGLNELFEQIRDNSGKLLRYCRKTEEAKFQENLSYKNTSGEEYSQKRGEIILHVINHSTFHRGQIITLARQSNMQNLPPTDLIHYLRTHQDK